MTDKLLLTAQDVGRRFKRRDGEIVTITEYMDRAFYQFKLNDGEFVSELGDYLAFSVKHQLDLVERLPSEEPDEPSTFAVTLPQCNSTIAFSSVKPPTLADAIAALNPTDGDVLDLNDETMFAVFACNTYKADRYLILDGGSRLYMSDWHLFPAPPGLRVRKPVPKKVTHKVNIALHKNGYASLMECSVSKEHAKRDGAEIREIEWTVEVDAP